VDTLSGRASLVTGRATARGEVLELMAAALRQAVDALPEIGETVLKAFLTRRTLLLSDGFEGIKIIGSRFSPDKSILVATGVEYRRLDVPRLSEFEGAGVYYAATDTETKLCRNEEVVVVGAGNSAGQAIVALSRHARRVHVIARGQDLGKSMSRYLVDRVEQIDNVQIHRGAAVTALEGDGHLEAIRVRDDAGVETRINTPALFLFIGADPHTEWPSLVCRRTATGSATRCSARPSASSPDVR
jgi:alkyl hydroperoxide reductase subunit AhpF